MRILLVQTPTSHFGAGEKVYPLGLARLASLIFYPHTKSVLDMNLLPDPWPELKKKLLEFRPDMVALSFRNLDPLGGHHVSYLSSLKTSARLIRRLLPKTRIWAGGPAFTLFGKRLMKEVPELDGGLIGEGEATFPRLLSPSLVPDNIPGLIYRSKGDVKKNSSRSEVIMDELPHLDIDAFSPKAYVNGNNYVAAMGIEGKRGCDLHCAYCLYPALGGRKMRLRSPRLIVDEMEALYKEHGLTLFHFTDSVVNRPEDHFEAVCREILNRRLNLTWTGFFREDTLTERSLDLALNAGLIAIYFSADALNRHGLHILKKSLTRSDILNAARITAKYGVLTMSHFLINLPGETSLDQKESLELLEQILAIHEPVGNLGAIIFNNIRLYPDAPLTRKIINEGLIDPETDLLYPFYYNPPRFAHVLHEMEALCHEAGVFSRLKISD